MKRFLKRNLVAALIATTALTNQVSLVYANVNNTINYSNAYTSEFDVTKPFDKDLYYARSILSEEGKKAWDVAIDILLKYDNSDNKYPIENGNSKVVINYKDLGINIDKTQAQYIQKYLVRQEPRMFHLKDWGATVNVDKNGIVETQTFYIGNGASEGDKYQETLLKIDEEANKILSVVKDDMTIYQKIQAVQKAFEASVVYQNVGSPSDLRGAFLNKKAICGGYSKGFEYLLLKLGVQNIWVDGMASGFHAWNHVNIDGKWYLMDTTWGGENWYLRGEVEERFAYDTYHIMPKLEKEGVAYKLGTYPGVWISVPSKITVLKGSRFYPLDYILDIGDIYETDFVVGSTVDVIQNDVNTEVSGSYKVAYETSNRDGNKARAEMNVEVVDGKKMSVNKLERLSGNLTEKEVSLYLNGGEMFFYDGLFGAENSYIEYNIEDKNATYFEANVGINKNVRDNQNYGHYGKVQFQVYADSNLIYESSVLGWKDNYENIVVKIPESTKTLKLVNTPKGSGNNHGGWGYAKIVVANN